MTRRELAFASDYDGTLVHPGNVLYPSDVLAVRKFQAQGGMFGACSGRALNAVVGPADKAGIKLDFVVASSGALVLGADQVLESHPVDQIVIGWLVSHYRGVWMAVHTTSRLLVETDPTTPYQTKVESLGTSLDEPVYSVSINFDDEAKAAEAVELIGRRFGDLVQPFQNVGSVDVVARGCSKGQGIETVRRSLSMDVIGGIGDSYNDVSLLDEVDVPFTFHSSPHEVQAHARYLVGSVAEALEVFQGNEL